MSAAGSSVSVQIEPADHRFPAAAGESLLEAALQAGIELPSSCRNGTCRTCLCRLLSGEVRYRIEWPGVSLDERDEGWILPCVAEPVGDVRLQVPGAREIF